jgi:hypothetical protein
LQQTARSVCARTCDSVADCTGLVSGSCCARPGFPVIERICIPAGNLECGGRH